MKRIVLPLLQKAQEECNRLNQERISQVKISLEREEQEHINATTAQSNQEKAAKLSEAWDKYQQKKSTPPAALPSQPDQVSREKKSILIWTDLIQHFAEYEREADLFEAESKAKIDACLESFAPRREELTQLERAYAMQIDEIEAAIKQVLCL